MYSQLAFGLILLGIFSILENIKNVQKFSLLGYLMIVILFSITAASTLDFLTEYGYQLQIYKDIVRIVSTLLTINFFFIIFAKKVPKLVIGLELFFILLFIIVFINGFQFPVYKAAVLLNKFTFFNQFVFALYFIMCCLSILYIGIKLHQQKPTENLYDAKIRKWFSLIIYSCMFLMALHAVFYIVYLKGTLLYYFDSRVTLFSTRLMLLLFILYRPKFLDDHRQDTSFNRLLIKNKGILFKDFEFMFYFNNYYLNPKASLDDFALKLNRSKEEVVDFFKNELEENFTDLLNQNRIEYFKELLKAKKYESFTIEALSEMSGFGTRRTMYSAFNKFVGMTPSDYINSLK